MTSILLDVLKLTPIDRVGNIAKADEHFFSPAKMFDFTESLSYYLANITPYVPLINEYCATWCHILLFSSLSYFIFCSLDYFILYYWKKDVVMPKYFGDFMIKHEIYWSVINLIGQAFLTSFIFMALPRFSYIYYDINDYGWAYFALSVIMHIIFDEFWTYWAHRWLHTYHFLYKYLHESHHLPVDVTPYAALAFHPLDALMQGIPTMTSCFFFPIHYNFYLYYLAITAIWAIFIHDNAPVLPIKLLLYCTHHTIHHEPGIGKLRNYGKFTSVMDRIMGSYEDASRIDHGWERNKTFMKFCNWINGYVDYYIPNNMLKKWMRGTLSKIKDVKDDKEDKEE